MTLLENVLTELEKKYLQTGRGAQFEVLSGFLSWRAEAPTYAVAAAKLDMDEGAVRVAVHRLRKRYRGLLEKHISATVDSAAEVDEELDHLMTVFST